MFQEAFIVFFLFLNFLSLEWNYPQVGNTKGAIIWVHFLRITLNVCAYDQFNKLTVPITLFSLPTVMKSCWDSHGQTLSPKKKSEKYTPNGADSCVYFAHKFLHLIFLVGSLQRSRLRFPRLTLSKHSNAAGGKFYLKKKNQILLFMRSKHFFFFKLSPAK